MKRYLILLCIIGLCVFFFESTVFGFALNISPPSFHASVKPGGSTSGTVSVYNKSDEDIGILVYTQDWIYNPDGSKTFLAAGTTPLSCAKWIRIFPKKFKLKAGDKMAVQYTVALPDDAQGGYYAVIFFESVPADVAEQDEGMMIRFSGRLGAIAYLETEGRSTKRGTVKAFSVTPPQSNKPLEMRLTFKNEGNVYIGAEGTLNIIDDEGNVFGKEIFGPINTLPGESRETAVQWLCELEEGSYYAIATLDIGTDEPLVKEAEITISSGGAIKSLSVEATSGMPMFSVIVNNTGQLNIDVGGRLEVFEANGEPTASLDLKDTLIAPGKDRELRAALQEKLPQGAYKVKAIISIGEKELTKEEMFSIK